MLIQLFKVFHSLSFYFPPIQSLFFHHFFIIIRFMFQLLYHHFSHLLIILVLYFKLEANKVLLVMALLKLFFKSQLQDKLFLQHSVVIIIIISEFQLEEVKPVDQLSKVPPLFVREY